MASRKSNFLYALDFSLSDDEMLRLSEKRCRSEPEFMMRNDWKARAHAELRAAGRLEADQAIAYTQQCVVAPLDTRIALAAADLHRQYKLATADAVVYATAIEYGADLLTCDAHFDKLPGFVLVRKSA